MKNCNVDNQQIWNSPSIDQIIVFPINDEDFEDNEFENGVNVTETEV